ncbi:MAG: (deoxy)nucleoside triphosphate pyrophosphohydrolase [Rickettsiales bacterium]
MGCCDTDVNAALAKPNPLVLAACAVLHDEDGRILIAERPAGKPYAGFWEFPGGKMHQGESPQSALSRELKEELDIETCCGCFTPFRFISHPYPECHVLIPVFSCRQWSGVPRGAEGQKLAWIYPKDAERYALLPSNIDVIRELSA